MKQRGGQNPNLDIPENREEERSNRIDPNGYQKPRRENTSLALSAPKEVCALYSHNLNPKVYLPSRPSVGIPTIGWFIWSRVERRGTHPKEITHKLLQDSFGSKKKIYQK